LQNPCKEHKLFKGCRERGKDGEKKLWKQMERVREVIADV